MVPHFQNQHVPPRIESNFIRFEECRHGRKSPVRVESFLPRPGDAGQFARRGIKAKHAMAADRGDVECSIRTIFHTKRQIDGNITRRVGFFGRVTRLAIAGDRFNAVFRQALFGFVRIVGRTEDREATDQAAESGRSKPVLCTHRSHRTTPIQLRHTVEPFPCIQSMCARALLRRLRT